MLQFKCSLQEPPTLSFDESAGFSAPGAFGTYRVLHQIGSGVLGPVFRTYDPQRDRLVAVKAFRLDVVPEATARLAEALRRLAASDPKHPAIVAAVDAGLEGTTAYLAMEYVAAETLDVALRHLAPAPLDRALPLLTQIADAIEAGRAAGLSHGVLHPRDIFVTPGTHEVRVTGFGVAAALESAGIKSPVRRPYMAPERANGEPGDIRSDVYSLGMLAHELLTKRRPAGPGEQDGALVTGTTPEQRVIIRRILSAALAERPDRRFATPSALVAALGAVMRGEPVGALPEPEDESQKAEAKSQKSDEEDIKSLDPDNTVKLPEKSAAPPKPVPAPPPLAAAPPPAAPASVPRTVLGPSEPTMISPPKRRAIAPPGPNVQKPAVEIEPDPPAPAPPPPAVKAAPPVAKPAPPPPVSARPPAPSPKPPVSPPIAPPPAASVTQPAANAPISGPVLSLAQPPPAAASSFPWLAVIAASTAGFVLGGAVVYWYAVGRDGAIPPVSVQAPLAPKPADTEVTVPPPATSPQAPPPAKPASVPEPAPATGRLLVRSVPNGASIVVNGRGHGVTPATVRDLSFGALSVQVSHPGYQPKLEKITLTADQPARNLTVELEPIKASTSTAAASAPKPFGSILVMSRPRGARVLLDGRVLGTTPLSAPELTPGSHTLRFELGGYKPLTRTVLVKAGEQTRVDVMLEQGSSLPKFQIR